MTSETPEELYERARKFAAERHASQMYGDQPYIVHLEAVREVLRWAGYEDGHSLSIAAWLHDVVEDTETTIDEIRALFGENVADLVWAVTGVGANRTERNASMYEKCRRCPRAVYLKLADRIANVEAARANDPPKLKMYQKEMFAFHHNLKDWGLPSMWKRLHLAVWGER